MLLPSLRLLQLCGQSPEDGLTRSWFLGHGKARQGLMSTPRWPRRPSEPGEDGSLAPVRKSSWGPAGGWARAEPFCLAAGAPHKGAQV